MVRKTGAENRRQKIESIFMAPRSEVCVCVTGIRLYHVKNVEVKI